MRCMLLSPGGYPHEHIAPRRRHPRLLPLKTRKACSAGNGSKVLRSISLSLRGCLGIISESSSGKSTLGRVLSGLLKPERGHSAHQRAGSVCQTLRPRGCRPAPQPFRRFQDYTSSANPRFRVEHIIEESLRALERSTGQRVDRRARICELLEQVGLPAQFISAIRMN